jgi:hypothetical protein
MFSSRPFDVLDSRAAIRFHTPRWKSDGSSGCTFHEANFFFSSSSILIKHSFRQNPSHFSVRGFRPHNVLHVRWEKPSEIFRLIRLAAVATGALFAGTLPAKADQYATELSNPLTKHGLPVPGAYFKNKENQQPAKIAVSKSGNGIDRQKLEVSKPSKTHTKQGRSADNGS